MGGLMNDPGQSVHKMNIAGQSINVSVQHVVAEYLDCRQTAAIFCSRVKPTENDERIYICQQINLKLDEIHNAIFPPPDVSKNIFLAWRLIHRVGEDLILLMTPEELCAQGSKILHDLKTSTLPDIIKLDWLTKIEESLKRLEELQKTTLNNSGEGNKKDGDSQQQVDSDGAIKEQQTREIKRIAQIFRTVTNNINDYVDDRFWDIWSRKFISMLYAASLAVGLFLLMLVFYKCGNATLGFFTILLIGAIGGVSSGILSADQDFLAKGHFWISVISYPLQRIVQGALAAFIMFAMIQSGFFIRITPPIDQQQPVPLVFDGYSSKCVKQLAVAQKNISSSQLHANAGQTAPGGSGGQRQPTGTADKPALTSASKPIHKSISSPRQAEPALQKEPIVDLKTTQNKQFYLYLIMLFLAGFTGDKLLKYISDKVTSRLFVEAEKTKEMK